MEQKDNYIQIYGTIKAVLFQNEENGYTVIKLETQDGEDITVVLTAFFLQSRHHRPEDTQTSRTSLRCSQKCGHFLWANK